MKGAYDSYTFEQFTDGDFKMINDNGKFWIHTYTGTVGSNNLIKLPESIKYGGNTYSRYGLLKDTFKNVSGYFELYMPTAVKELDNRVFDTVYPSIVYYSSNETSWASLVSGVYYYYFSVYYKSDCIHRNGYWKYDSSGKITTAIDTPKESEFVMVVSPTCTEGGYSVWTCPHCHDYTIPRDEGALGHSFRSDGKCSRCTARKIKITSENIDTYSAYITFDLYNFTIDKKGNIKSTNTEVDSTAELIMEVKRAGITVEFEYEVQSSNYWNYAQIYDSIGGYSYEIREAGNHSREFYSKGRIEFAFAIGSGTESGDYATVKNIYVIIP